MVRKGYTPEQIINKLREAEIQINQGITIGEASRKLGVTEQTYYRWRKEYGGMRVEQAKRLKEIEKENTRLKKLVADLSLDNAILKEAAASQDDTTLRASYVIGVLLPCKKTVMQEAEDKKFLFGSEDARQPKEVNDGR